MWYIILDSFKMIFEDFITYGMMLREFENKGVKIKEFGFREDIE